MSKITSRSQAREALIEIEILAAAVHDWAAEERPKTTCNENGRLIALEAEAQTIQSTALWCQDVIEADMPELTGDEDDD